MIIWSNFWTRDPAWEAADSSQTPTLVGLACFVVTQARGLPPTEDHVLFGNLCSSMRKKSHRI